MTFAVEPQALGVTPIPRLPALSITAPAPPPPNKRSVEPVSVKGRYAPSAVFVTSMIAPFVASHKDENECDL